MSEEIDMSDPRNVLTSLSRAVPTIPATPDIVAGDVARGRRALIQRRRRRTTMLSASAALVAVVAIGGAQLAGSGGSTPQATGSAPSATPDTAGTAPAPQVRLVAYTGAQPAGFEVSTVPDGWQIVDSDTSSFILAPPDADTELGPKDPAGGQLISLAGRIAVSLKGLSRLPDDAVTRTVTINGNRGVLGLPNQGDSKDPVLWLHYSDGAGHDVQVQLPQSLGLTDAQIVQFAEGITVTDAATPIGG
jgi:hypothetical protein